MKRVMAVTFLIIMLTMAVLAGGFYLAAGRYVDPSLARLETAAAQAPAEAQRGIMPHLVRVTELRRSANLYVPLFFFVAGVIAAFILSLLMRRTARRDAVTYPEEPGEEAPAEGKGAPVVPEVDPAEAGAAGILFILQNKGRLIDFLQEDIARYPDAQIGAAVRAIHDDCARALNEHVTLAPVISEKEAEEIEILEGFDSSEIRLTGDITGEPPFRGTVQHPGWKITRIDLPGRPRGQNPRVVAPAEVEIGRQDEEM